MGRFFNCVGDSLNDSEVLRVLTQQNRLEFSSTESRIGVTLTLGLLRHCLNRKQDAIIGTETGSKDRDRDTNYKSLLFVSGG